MNRTIFLLFTALLFIAACDDNTVNRFTLDKDIVAVNDTDDLTGDDLLNDDGQLINDDGQIINDDGQIINDDGQIVNDDGQIINDDNEVVNDDGEVVPDDNEWTDDGTIITDDGTVWPDDNEWTDDGTVWPDDGPIPTDDGTVWPDDGPMPTDDGVIWPDQDWTDDVKPDDDSTTVSCGDNNGCAQTEYCAKPAGNCNTFLAGTCEDRPQMCPPLYSPVCGCDGTTYGSECDASAAGVNVDYAGECGTTPGCYGNEECTDSSGTKQFCLYGVGACYGPGTCTDIPMTCPDLYAPVCGCDMMTYENECYAYQAGASIMYEGECQEEKYSTLYYYYDQDTMNAPEATVVIRTDDGEVQFIGAELMTRTTPDYGFTIYLNTVFYGLTDDGSQLEFQLKLSSIGWSIPKTVTLDGGDNYARWTRLGNELVGNLYGDVTIQQYTRQDTVITLIEINGDYLSYTPNIVP